MMLCLYAPRVSSPDHTQLAPYTLLYVVPGHHAVITVVMSYNQDGISRILTLWLFFVCSQLLVHDPTKRYSLSAVLAHPWIRNNAQTPTLPQPPAE